MVLSVTFGLAGCAAILPEQRVPTGAKFTNVEHTQARKLDVECFEVRRCGSDSDARHGGAYRDWAFDQRVRDVTLLTRAIW
jgi:hypothetical protein